MIMDQNKVLADSGGSLSNPGCYEFNFSVSTTAVQQAKHISLSIDNVRILGGATDTDCESGRTTLKQKYPGLDFQCAIGSGNYYTNLQLPAGMTTAQVDQLIVDAVEHAIYGPWVLTIQ